MKSIKTKKCKTIPKNWGHDVKDVGSLLSKPEWRGASVVSQELRYAFVLDTSQRRQELPEGACTLRGYNGRGPRAIAKLAQFYRVEHPCGAIAYIRA